MMHFFDDRELEAYLTGELAAEMGLRCALGPAVEYGPLSTSRATPQEPTSGALAAARTASRVEDTLEALSTGERAVLVAWYQPAPGLRSMADRQIESVARLLVGEERIRELTRTSRAQPTKAAEDHERSRTREAAREARRELTRIASRAREAVGRAREAYRAAAAERRREMRRKRHERRMAVACGCSNPPA